MSENNLEQKLADEREKLKLNSLNTLKFLGYKNDLSKLTQEQLDARIELLMEQKRNAQLEATKQGNLTQPAMFTGMDEEKENIKAVQNASPSELDQAEFMEGYDALTALIPVLRPNNQVGHAEAFGPREDIRIIRLPASIKLNSTTEIMRRVLL